ncbi:hypothetical protein MWN34_01500 [Ancylobacter sp. 6x-1]|uniref:Nucleotidyl transferase domain-containing protein n=1 Tax=Ancylobacter crimeensis TaxID=2579147 RepID=A0ABT0D6L3_9HYPH|nr:sugar phosphate nucleotidyltransferase [Ancylobacter crimeensis]MCK0195581.1 hypothetical protein [Ancylobacter crimeensis]
MIEQCVILCDGFGSSGVAAGSAVPATLTPPTLTPVAGIAFLERVIADLARQGVRRVLLVAVPDHAALRDFAAREEVFARLGLSVSIAAAPEAAGTGGALWQVREALDDSFFVLSGQSWFDIPLTELARLLREGPDQLGVLALRQVTEEAGLAFEELDLDSLDLDPDELAALMSAMEAEDEHEPEQAASKEDNDEDEDEDEDDDAGPVFMPAGAGAFRRAIAARLTPSSSLMEDVVPDLVDEGLIGVADFEAPFIEIARPGAEADAARLMAERPALFLARDALLAGTGPTLEWTPGAREAIRAANEAGHYVFVLAEGPAGADASEDDHQALMARLAEDLATIGTRLDDSRFLPALRAHDAAAAMLPDLMRHWRVDAARSVAVGLAPADLAAARAAGIADLPASGGDLRALLAGSNGGTPPSR